MRSELRGFPPCAPPYVWYTYRLQAFVESLWGRMTVTDLAALTGLGWDTVKNIIKARLEQDYGHPSLRPLQRLSIDEIYFGRHKKFYTLVIDLDTGQIVWVAKGKGGEALRPFWRALRLSHARIEAVANPRTPSQLAVRDTGARVAARWRALAEKANSGLRMAGFAGTKAGNA